MVEFALVAPVFLLFVVGIIMFGVALNFWLDLQRLANQGARWAVVNTYPGCTRTDPNTPSCGTGISLQRYIACQTISGGQAMTATVSFPSSTKNVGDPVQITVQKPFKMMPFLGVGDLTLRAKATMRLEQTPVRYDAGSYTPPPCP